MAFLCAPRAHLGGETVFLLCSAFLFSLSFGDFGDGLDGFVYLFLGVEGADAEPDGAVNLGGAELLVEQGGAMKAGAAGDLVVHVEHGAGVGGVEAVNVE